MMTRSAQVSWPPDPGGRALAFTFDDGPDPRGTPAVLAALAAASVRATFFVLAERVAEHPRLLADVLRAGHDVEVHGYGHEAHTGSSEAAVAADLDRALAVLADAGGRPSRWRVPYGLVAGFTSGLARSRGLVLAHWTLDPQDWAGHTAEAMLAGLEPRLVPGDVVLLHDGVGPGALRSDARETAALVEPLARAARARELEPQPLASPRRAHPAVRRCGGARPRCCARSNGSSESRACRRSRRRAYGCPPTGSRRTTGDMRTRPRARSAASSRSGSRCGSRRSAAARGNGHGCSSTIACCHASRAITRSCLRPGPCCGKASGQPRHADIRRTQRCPRGRTRETRGLSDVRTMAAQMSSISPG
jgi:peptidoglycan/xylan/chitin deacetylase (PgdA/CDA1 family)